MRVMQISSTLMWLAAMYEEVIDLLRGVARRGQVVGIDLVEVAPPYDATGATSLLAAQLLLRFLGYVFAPEAPESGRF